VIRATVMVRSRLVRAALERALGQRPDLIVSAASPPHGDVDVVLVDAAELTSPHFLGGDREPAVIALAEALDDAVVAKALRQGARGVLPYDASPGELTAAVEAAVAGLVVVPAAVGALLTSLKAARPENGYRREDTALTDREREVLALLAAGLPNHGIADRLGISASTVKTYVATILEKLDAATRAEAVAIGLRRGLLLL